MRIISKPALTRFAARHCEALEPLMYWYGIAKHARWENLMDMRRDFGHADAAGPYTVFNIGGNKYRLAVLIKYRWQVIYLRHVLTHKQYTQEKWKS